MLNAERTPTVEISRSALMMENVFAEMSSVGKKMFVRVRMPMESVLFADRAILISARISKAAMKTTNVLAIMSYARTRPSVTRKMLMEFAQRATLVLMTLTVPLGQFATTTMTTTMIQL